jgi:D-cysteine desulfhydrase family pyridoxal phosphate-dependent enzyme
MNNPNNVSIQRTALERRVSLFHVQTPLEPMERLAKHLGMKSEHLWVQRDDLTGLGGGGNKARQLEYLCNDALAQGCDTLVTGGARQSNHVRMTAAAANRLGLACTVILTSDEEELRTGNVLLDDLLGPEIVWAGARSLHELEEETQAVCTHLVAQGHKPYAIPLGGGNALGSLGYTRLALELVSQVPQQTLVVTACGSGGTHAGLVAGFGSFAQVLGIDAGVIPDLIEHVTVTAAAAAKLANLASPTGQCVVDQSQIGEGYGRPTAESTEALHLAARLEGLILDPVYTSKALAGLIAAIRAGRIATDTFVVFLHTGGLPSLFA